MSRRLELTPEAESDLAEAFDYYEGQLAGLGPEFLATVEQQFEWLAQNPMQYQVSHRDVRRAVLRRFPYAVFYLFENEAVIVLAVEHQARDPDHWKQRL